MGEQRLGRQRVAVSARGAGDKRSLGCDRGRRAPAAPTAAAASTTTAATTIASAAWCVAVAHTAAAAAVAVTRRRVSLTAGVRHWRCLRDTA